MTISCTQQWIALCCRHVRPPGSKTRSSWWTSWTRTASTKPRIRYCKYTIAHQPKRSIHQARISHSASIGYGVSTSRTVGTPTKPTANPQRHYSTTHHKNNPSINQSRNASSSSSSSSHDSLKSFLKYAERTNLSPMSTTYQGTLFEYLALEHLSRNLGFQLTRVGGRNDSGIDLLGSWALPAAIRSQIQKQSPSQLQTASYTSHAAPSHSISRSDSPSEAEPTPDPETSSNSLDATPDNITAPSNTHSSASPEPKAIPVVIQCKRQSRVTPTLIRELEGSFLAAPAAFRAPQDLQTTLGILICSRPATKGIRDAMSRSRKGLAWVMLEEGSKDATDGDDGGAVGQVDGTDRVDLYVRRAKVRQFLWNRAADEYCGLQGVSVGLWYDGDHADGEVNLLWQGRPLDFTAS